jgi:CheY-like chemotaxis protein
MSEDHTLISIVDDDALARDGIKELVESLGYKARTFVSAEHFLESGLIAETACLITDLQMPGLNGLELQEALRSQGCRIPIILITAFPNEKHRNRALEGGALGWRKGSELPTFLSDIIAKLKPGEVSEPLRTPTGYHIIRLNEVRGGTESAMEDQVHVRHILMKTNELADDATVRGKLEALRAAHSALPLPREAGRSVGSRAKR